MKSKLEMFLLVAATLLLFRVGVVVSGQTRPHDRIDDSKKEVDLRPILKNKQLHEGTNLIYTDDRGVRISAKVKRGKIVEWVAADDKGKDLPLKMDKKKGRPSTGPNSPPRTDPPPSNPPTCSICVEHTVDLGGTSITTSRCYTVPCST